MAEFVNSGEVVDEFHKDGTQNDNDIAQFVTPSEDTQGLSEVIVLSDIAEETVVTTTKNLSSQNGDNLNVEASITEIHNNKIAISNTEPEHAEVITADMLENGYQISVTPEVVWNEVIKGFQEESGEIDMIKIQPETFIAINPGSSSEEGPSQNVYQIDNSDISMREITKRERDKQKKREQRADPAFRAKEKAKNRERMKAKRKNDLDYRAQEKAKDRDRRRIVRQTNEELRNKERERDREYKRYLRETDREYKVGILRDDESNIMTEPIMDISLI